MNGNFQNNYRGGWNHIPFIGFSPGPFNYNYQIPLYWGPVNYNYRIPHQNPAIFHDNRPLLHQMPQHYVDNRHLPHQIPTYYYDPRHLWHPMPAHYFYPRPFLLQMPEHNTDMRPLPHVYNRNLPHKEQENSADKKNLPHETPEDSVDIKQIPQQTPESCTDERCLPHQTAEDHTGKKCLPHQKPEEFADKRSLLHPKAEDDADNKCLPLRRSECIADRMSLPQQSPDLSQQTPEDTGEKDRDFKVENVKNETPNFQKKKVPDDKSKRKVRDNTDVKDHGSKRETGAAPGGKYLKMCNGIRSPKIASVLAEGSSFELQSEHVSASLSQESKGKEHHKFQNTTLEKNDQPKSTPVELNASETSNISTETESKSCDFAAIVTPEVHVASREFTSSPKMESNFEHKNHIDSQREVTEAKEHHKIQNCALERNDQLNSISMELLALGCSNINTIDEDKFSVSGAAAIVPLQGSVTSQALTQSAAVGSSFEHLEVQNGGVETNDQPHSISMEFHGPAGSDINTMIVDTCSDSGAIVLAPPQSPIAFQLPTPVSIIQTEMSESEVHNEVQNDIVDSSDQQRLISMELYDPSGSMTNNQTEIVNFDSAAIEIVIEPLASAPPDAVGSSFEPLTKLGLHTETEPQVHEAVAYIECQHPTEETDIELLPSVLMEIDVASEVRVETETEDRVCQAEVEMDVLAGELGIIHLPQVSVCLMCGDKGFEEAMVYCNKCGDYSMHRYCLEGPVVFTDDVIWFCEDCEEIFDVDYPDSETIDSKKCEVDSSKKCATFVDPQPIVDPIWRGSLQVFNKSFDKITRLTGHLSTLACPKVLEEIRHLPNVLYGDLLQRSAVWPESFRKFGTDKLSIGLYFFPQNERVVRYFDQLVDEMISNDLAIRVGVEKTELLIFPSTLLPRQYKRFQSKYFLWGIFKRKQEPFKINDNGSGNDASY